MRLYSTDSPTVELGLAFYSSWHHHDSTTTNKTKNNAVFFCVFSGMALTDMSGTRNSGLPQLMIHETSMDQGTIHCSKSRDQSNCWGSRSERLPRRSEFERMVCAQLADMVPGVGAG